MGVRNYDHAVAHQELQPPEHKNGTDIPMTRDEHLALTMYSCLPWELRDRIHTFCVQGSYDNEVIVRRATGSKVSLFVRQSSDAHSYQWTEDPFFLHLGPDRIGRRPARELLHAYYAKRNFSFAHRELGLVQTFLETDEFGLGVRPVDHVRRLHLQIQPFSYARLRDSKSKDGERILCYRALEALAAFKNERTTVTIHIDMAHDLSDDEEYGGLMPDAAEFVCRIVRIISALHTDRLKIELILEGEWDERNGLQLCSGSVALLDDCMFQMKVACQ